MGKYAYTSIEHIYYFTTTKLDPAICNEQHVANGVSVQGTQVGSL